jgi:DNA-binding HxlR family transcriptional regulator
MGLELEPIVMELASWGHKNIPGTNNAIEQARKYLRQKSKL